MIVNQQEENPSIHAGNQINWNNQSVQLSEVHDIKPG